MQKRIFHEEEHPIITEQHQPKQEFHEAEVSIEPESKEVEAELIIEESLKPSRFWGRVLLSALILFGVAVFAQSIQWLIDTFQARQWIYFAFSIAFLGVSLIGVGAIVNEWRKLVWLRKHDKNQQISQQLLLDKATTGQISTTFCKSVLANLRKTPVLEQAEKRWLSQLDDAYNSQEVLTLFSRTILHPIDQKVKKMVSQSAIENAMIVTMSPLAIVDVLMVAWRNIALINKITRAYGMELGYFSRLRLFRMVLTNMVFAGVTEMATDVGGEFFSQNFTAKISMRVAQGVGVGLLTARLGIKAMEFCRPVAFMKNERPTLSEVRQELLGVLKEKIFSKSTEKEREIV